MASTNNWLCKLLFLLAFNLSIHFSGGQYGWLFHWPLKCFWTRFLWEGDVRLHCGTLTKSVKLFIAGYIFGGAAEPHVLMMHVRNSFWNGWDIVIIKPVDRSTTGMEPCILLFIYENLLQPTTCSVDGLLSKLVFAQSLVCRIGIATGCIWWVYCVFKIH